MNYSTTTEDYFWYFKSSTSQMLSNSYSPLSSLLLIMKLDSADLRVSFEHWSYYAAVCSCFDNLMWMTFLFVTHCFNFEWLA